MWLGRVFKAAIKTRQAEGRALLRRATRSLDTGLMPWPRARDCREFNVPPILLLLSPLHHGRMISQAARSATPNPPGNTPAGNPSCRLRGVGVNVLSYQYATLCIQTTCFSSRANFRKPSIPCRQTFPTKTLLIVVCSNQTAITYKHQYILLTAIYHKSTTMQVTWSRRTKFLKFFSPNHLAS